MSLAEDFFSKLEKCEPTMRQSLQTIQQVTSRDKTHTAVWAAGCLSKIIGIIDSVDDVERLISVAKSQNPNLDHVLAMNKASCTYDNLLSLMSEDKNIHRYRTRTCIVK